MAGNDANGAGGSDIPEEFGVVIWLHIYDLGDGVLTNLIANDQTIFCIQSPNFNIAETNVPREELCLHYNFDNFYWAVGDDLSQQLPQIWPRNWDYLSNLLQDDNEEWIVDGNPVGDRDYVDFVHMDMAPVVGWNMLAFNVRVETNITAFEGWRLSGDYSSYNHTGDLYKSVYKFTPGNDGENGLSETLCFGARLTMDNNGITADKEMNGVL